MDVSTWASRLPRSVITIGKSVSDTVKKRNSSPRSPKSRDMLQTATDSNPTATTMIVPIRGTRNRLIRAVIRPIFMSVLLAFIRCNPFTAGRLPANTSSQGTAERSLRLSSSASRRRMHGLEDTGGRQRVSRKSLRLRPVWRNGAEYGRRRLSLRPPPPAILFHLPATLVAISGKTYRLHELPSCCRSPTYHGALSTVQPATFLNHDTCRGCRSFLPSQRVEAVGIPGMTTVSYCSATIAGETARTHPSAAS